MDQKTGSAHNHRQRQASGRRGMPRLVGQLWGSTNFRDIFSAFKYITIKRSELVDGPALKTFEEAFARRVGVRHAISFSSGRLAMYALLRAMGIKEGDEVLLQVPSHIVVANAIRYVGAKPVFVDCDLNTYNMDLRQAEERITPRTKVLLLQHTFGIPADMEAAQELARRHNLIILEDCVHALGSTYNGQSVGSFGKAAFFSTEETKVISSTMGGMAVTDDDTLAERLRAFQQTCPWPSAALVARYLFKLIVYHLLGHPNLHPYTRPVYLYLRRHPQTHLAPGATSHEEMRGDVTDRLPENYLLRFSNGQAAIALRQLERLDENLAHRRWVAAQYTRRLSQLGYHVPCPPPGSQPSFVRFPLWVDDRAHAMKWASRRVVLGQWFNVVLEEATSKTSGGYTIGSCPRAEAAAEHMVNVPTHMRVKENDIEVIAELLAGTPHTNADLKPLLQPVKKTSH